MNNTQHLLSCLAEECCETGQRVSKALRFGLSEVQASTVGNPKQLNNAQRISEELADLYAVGLMLVEAMIIPDFRSEEHINYKRERIAQYMAHARKSGALNPEESPLIVTNGDGAPLPDQAAAVQELKRQMLKTAEPVEGKQVKVLSIMGEQIEFPDEFNAHQMLSVVIEVLKERSRQVTARGSEEDRRWSPLDWKEMIDDYSAMARRAMTMRKADEARRRYIQVAALALAAVEAFDKNRAEALREEVQAAQPGGGRRFFKGEQP